MISFNVKIAKGLNLLEVVGHKKLVGDKHQKINNKDIKVMQRKIKLKTFLELVKRINSGSKWVKINITVETKGGLISYSHEKFTPHKAEIKAQHVSCDFQQMCHKYGVETRLIETDTCC